MIRGHLTSTDAIIAAHDDASEDGEPCPECEHSPDGFLIIDGVCVLCPACKGTRIAGGMG
jgi:hypothetical protein